MYTMIVLFYIGGGVYMSNSGLVCYTLLSPNHSGHRTHAIDRITPHCVVGRLSCESICGCFTSPSRQASCNYGIGNDGRISLCVEEKNRSWCSSSNANDQRAVTIECASDKSDPYAMNSDVYNSLVNLCVDICKRNGKTKLIWFADKNTALNYRQASHEMILTVHRWFANKSCPGDWLYARMSNLANAVNAKLGSAAVIESGFQAKDLRSLSDEQVVEKIGKYFTEDNKKTGVLASVSMAQFILECGYGKSELAQNANNCFGMKKVLSGNTWAGSVWDGVSVYTKKTNEEQDGKTITITADFRKYACVEDSIEDHSAYLLNAKNGDKLRYAGLKGETNYKKAAQIIKNGGYATSSTYVQKICNIIERYNLTRFDVATSSNTDNNTSCGSTVTAFPRCPFSVHVLIDDLNYRSGPSMSYGVKGQTGKGTFTIVEVKDGWGKLKSGAGWIWLKNHAYCTVLGTVYNTVEFRPYKVRVDCDDINIRKGPGTNCEKTGKYTGKGVFTIVDEKKGAGSDKGWGLLKAYEKNRDGWISLDFVKAV